MMPRPPRGLDDKNGNVLVLRTKQRAMDDSAANKARNRASQAISMLHALKSWAYLDEIEQQIKNIKEG